jgi:glycerophosphoryl diester phosphodiesterase
MAALDGQTFPPNSLEGIQACLKAGAAFIEVDINALASGDYLLVHDEVLESETSGKGAVASCDPIQIRDLTIKHSGTVTSYGVPLLSQVVGLFQEDPGSAVLQLDFKNLVPFQDDEPLLRLVKLVEPIQQRVIVSTGADWQLRRLRRLAPWLRLGFDIMLHLAWEPDPAKRDPREFPKKLGAYGYYDDHILASQQAMRTSEYLRDRCESLAAQVRDVSVFYLDYRTIVRSLEDGFNWAEALHAQGIKLDAWTMDTTKPDAVQAAKSLLEAGVDLFTSNTPLAWAKLLAKA